MWVWGKTYYLARFLPKWNERNRRGGGVPRTPPPDLIKGQAIRTTLDGIVHQVRSGQVRVCMRLSMTRVFNRSVTSRDVTVTKRHQWNHVPWNYNHVFTGRLSWSTQSIARTWPGRTSLSPEINLQAPVWSMSHPPPPVPGPRHYLHPTRLILRPLHGNLTSHCPAALDHVTHYCMIILGHVTFYCEVTGSHVCGPFPDGFKPYPVCCQVSSLVGRTVTLVTSRSLSSHLNSYNQSPWLGKTQCYRTMFYESIHLLLAVILSHTAACNASTYCWL